MRVLVILSELSAELPLWISCFRSSFFSLRLTKRGGEKVGFFLELAQMTTDGAIHLRSVQERRGNSPGRREDSTQWTSHLSASLLVQERVRTLPARRQDACTAPTLREKVSSVWENTLHLWFSVMWFVLKFVQTNTKHVCCNVLTMEVQLESVQLCQNGVKYCWNSEM